MYFYKYQGNFFKSEILPAGVEEIAEETYMVNQKQLAERLKNLCDFVGKVNAGEITLEEVPEEYRVEVENMVNLPDPEQTYTLDKAAELIAQEVAANE